MADIELVIKIDEKLVEWIDEYYDSIRMLNGKKIGIIIEAIKNGVLLPTGHGKLKDIDSIKTAFPNGEYVRTESVRATIDHEETIIEANKEK